MTPSRAISHKSLVSLHLPNGTWTFEREPIGALHVVNSVHARVTFVNPAPRSFRTIRTALGQAQICGIRQETHVLIKSGLKNKSHQAVQVTWPLARGQDVYLLTCLFYAALHPTAATRSPWPRVAVPLVAITPLSNDKVSLRPFCVL